MENEYHFLVHCSAYEDVREEFVRELVERGARVSSDSEQEFVKSVLQKQAPKTTGGYIGIMYSMRRELMNSKCYVLRILCYVFFLLLGS